ncbi:hypothetical protein, partial [Priestia megaterium]|uniref:hypothetical protein n=1 Tax=Priestia megaterium TaxID=1404 RepID=UPI0035B5A6F0
PVERLPCGWLVGGDAHDVAVGEEGARTAAHDGITSGSEQDSVAAGPGPSAEVVTKTFTARSFSVSGSLGFPSGRIPRGEGS